MGDAAQYLIDVAAQAVGVDTTVAQLDALAKKLTGVGKDSVAFQDALSRVTSQLGVAREESSSAFSALSEGTSAYAKLERAAAQTAKAAERAALKNAGVVPPDLQATASAAASALASQAAVMVGLEAKSKAAAAAEKQLIDSLEGVKRLGGHVNKTMAQSSEQMSKLQSGLSMVGGPVGRLGQQVLGPVKGFSELRSVLGTSRAAMLVTVVGVGLLIVAVAALAVAVVAGAVAVAGFAVSLANTRRAAGLAQEAFAAMNPELAALDFTGLTRDTGVASERLRALAKSLTAAKVAAVDMPVAMRAAALAEAALGQGGADEFIASMREGKLSVQEFANTTEAKLGGIVGRQMLGLEAQGARFRSNISDLFGGLNIDPVLNAMQLLIGLFDRTTEGGRAMQMLFETVFQPLIDQAERAAQVVVGFALGFLIGLTKVYIALKPAIKAIGEFFGFEDTSLTDVCKLAAKAGEFMAKIFVGVAVVVGALALVIGGVTAAIFALSVGIIKGITWLITARESVTEFSGVLANAIGEGVTAAIAWLGSLPGKALDAIASVGGAFAGLPGRIASVIASVVAYFSGVNWGDLGASILRGLAAGITGATGIVVTAVKNAIGGAISAAKSLLGIHSPSRVFAGLGENTGEGFVGGVEGMTGEAQRATEGLVAPPVTTPLALQARESGANDVPRFASAVTAPAPAPAPASTGAAVSMAGATFNFSGIKDAEDAVSRFGEWLTRALEGDAAALGGATS
jgi:hypothetical protein